MPGLLVDRHAPVRRQRERIAKLEGRIFELRRELESARKELVTLEATAADAERAQKASR
jgi:hypothetical protein